MLLPALRGDGCGAGVWRERRVGDALRPAVQPGPVVPVRVRARAADGAVGPGGDELHVPGLAVRRAVLPGGRDAADAVPGQGVLLRGQGDGGRCERVQGRRRRGVLPDGVARQRGDADPDGGVAAGGGDAGGARARVLGGHRGALLRQRARSFGGGRVPLGRLVARVRQLGALRGRREHGRCGQHVCQDRLEPGLPRGVVPLPGREARVRRARRVRLTRRLRGAALRHRPGQVRRQRAVERPGHERCRRRRVLRRHRQEPRQGQDRGVRRRG